MDRVFSTRLDEAVVQQIGSLARQLGTTKKAVIERAIHALAREVEAASGEDVWSLTAGAWHRDEPVEVTVDDARKTFRESMDRHRS